MAFDFLNKLLGLEDNSKDSSPVMTPEQQAALLAELSGKQSPQSSQDQSVANLAASEKNSTDFANPTAISKDQSLQDLMKGMTPEQISSLTGASTTPINLNQANSTPAQSPLPPMAAENSSSNIPQNASLFDAIHNTYQQKAPEMDMSFPQASDSLPSPSASAKAPVVSPASSPSSSPDQNNPATIDFGKGLGIGNDAALKAAQDERNRIAFINQVGKAGSMIGAGFARANPEPGQKLFDENIKEANVPVEQLGQRVENEKNDPNSAISNGYKQLMQKFGVKISGDATAASLEKAAPWLERAYASQERNKERNFESLQKSADRNAMLQAAQLNKEGLLGAKQQQHTSDKQQQTMGQTVQMLESARGNPEISQALKDRYNASKVDLLLKQNYDPNNMSPQQINLLVSEVGKIATGGVPTHSEFSALSPNTLSSKLAGVYSQLMNKPTPANAGAFIKQYQNYAKDLQKNAQNVVNTKLGRVIEARKHDLGEDNYKALQEQYLGKSEDQDESDKHPTSGTQIFNAPQEAGIHAFMQTHPELGRDDAIEILKQNGKL